jgi:sugar-phosphatase
MPELGDFQMQAMLFGLNGVLAESTSILERAWLRWSTDHCLEPATVLRAGLGCSVIDAVTELLPAKSVEDIAAEAAAIEEMLLAQAHFAAPSPGATDILVDLGTRWAVVTTATRAVADAFLAAARLPTPPVLVTRDDVPFGKPAPDGYRQAAATLGVSPWGCLAIETFATGVSACRAAGVPVIGLGAESLPGTIGRVDNLRQISAVASAEEVRGVLRTVVPT